MLPGAYIGQKNFLEKALILKKILKVSRFATREGGPSGTPNRKGLYR